MRAFTCTEAPKHTRSRYVLEELRAGLLSLALEDELHQNTLVLRETKKDDKNVSLR